MTRGGACSKESAMIRAGLSAALFATVLVGCASRPARRAADYRTLTEAPGRQTQTARALHAEALALLEAGQAAEAEAALKRALEADVTFGPAHNNLGKVYFQRGRLYLAAWEFQYAAQLMPYLPEPRNNLGLVLEEVGKLDEAVPEYEAAHALEPDNPEPLANLARARVRRGDRDDRVRELLEAVVLKDPRPEWAEWAREQLGLRGGPRPPSPLDPAAAVTTRPRDPGAPDDESEPRRE